MIAELFVMVTFPSLISWVPVVIHSWVEPLASGWGAMRYLPSHMGVSGLVDRVIDSPGLSHVLVGGACSRIRLLTTFGPGAVVAFVCDALLLWLWSLFCS